MPQQWIFSSLHLNAKSETAFSYLPQCTFGCYPLNCGIQWGRVCSRYVSALFYSGFSFVTRLYVVVARVVLFYTYELITLCCPVSERRKIWTYHLFDLRISFIKYCKKRACRWATMCGGCLHIQLHLVLTKHQPLLCLAELLRKRSKLHAYSSYTFCMITVYSSSGL